MSSPFELRRRDDEPEAENVAPIDAPHDGAERDGTNDDDGGPGPLARADTRLRARGAAPLSGSRHPREVCVPLPDYVRSEVDACLAERRVVPLLSGVLLPPHPSVVRLAVTLLGVTLAFYSAGEIELRRIAAMAAERGLAIVFLPALAGLAAAVSITYWRRAALASEWSDSSLLWLLAVCGVGAALAHALGERFGQAVLVCWVSVYLLLFQASRSFRVNRAWLTLRWPYLVFVAVGAVFALAVPALVRWLARVPAP